MTMTLSYSFLFNFDLSLIDRLLSTIYRHFPIPISRPIQKRRNMLYLYTHLFTNLLIYQHINISTYKEKKTSSYFTFRVLYRYHPRAGEISRRIELSWVWKYADVFEEEVV